MDQQSKRELKKGESSGFMIYSPKLKRPIGELCGSAADAVIRGMKLVGFLSFVNFKLAGYRLISVKTTWQEVSYTTSPLVAQENNVEVRP